MLDARDGANLGRALHLMGISNPIIIMCFTVEDDKVLPKQTASKSSLIYRQKILLFQGNRMKEKV